MDLSSTLSRIEFPWAMGPLDAPVSDIAQTQFSQWLQKGCHGEMEYLNRYHDVRNDPRLLLPGACSIMVVAFPYYTSERINLPISLYARGRDYHEVVRRLMTDIATLLPPGETRICVDTAPLRERYWAERLRLGFIGKNNQLIIPGFGSYFFLGFLLTTAKLPSLTWRALPRDGCRQCRRCIDACPGRCIPDDAGAINARKCLSYLTIEYRGELPPAKLPTLYGCDICQRVCPFNQSPADTPIPEFHPSAEFAALTPADIAALTPEKFSSIFRHSAIKRTKLAGLLRNLRNLTSDLK